MSKLAEKFVRFCIGAEVLQFGDFQLRSGRRSPYFFNFGAFDSGEALSSLGQYYADKIDDDDIAFDYIFGPAYKGIPIATALSCHLGARRRGHAKVGFSRKEAKGRGEGGQIIGAKPEGRVLLVDDVLTSGSAAQETIDYLQRFFEVEIVGLLVGLDRQESAQLRDRIPVHAIANLGDVIDYIEDRPEYAPHLEAMRDYHRKNQKIPNSAPLFAPGEAQAV